jgi:transcriptional regulator with XRE-family HTH domain
MVIWRQVMGRKKYVEKRKYQIQSLYAKHHEIKRLDLLGFSQKKIAEEIGVTTQNIQDIQNSELYKREPQAASFARDCATFDVARAIEKEGPKCLQLLTIMRDNNVSELGESVPVSLRAHICQDLLDRSAKSAKVKQIQGEMRHAHLVVDTTIENLKQRARVIESYIGKAMEEELQQNA